MLGQHGVDIVSCRLALGHHDVDMMAGKRRDLRPDAISQPFIAEVCTPGKNCDAHTDRIFWRVKTQLAKPDLTTYDSALQNEWCNGPQPCLFRGVLSDPGSGAYAAGADGAALGGAVVCSAEGAAGLTAGGVPLGASPAGAEPPGAAIGGSGCVPGSSARATSIKAKVPPRTSAKTREEADLPNAKTCGMMTSRVHSISLLTVIHLQVFGRTHVRHHHRSTGRKSTP